MKIEVKEIYKCEYCNKLYQIKRFAIEHEKRCHKNPDNKRDCFDCKHLDKVDYSHTHFDHEGHDYTSRRSALFCAKTNQFLYPPSVEHKGNATLMEDMNDGTIENNPMPRLRKCDSFESDCFDSLILKLKEGK